MRKVRTHTTAVILAMGMLVIPTLGLTAGTEMRPASGKGAMSGELKKEMSAPMEKAMDSPMPADKAGTGDAMNKPASEAMEPMPATMMKPDAMPEAGNMEPKPKDTMN